MNHYYPIIIPLLAIIINHYLSAMLSCRTSRRSDNLFGALASLGYDGGLDLRGSSESKRRLFGVKRCGEKALKVVISGG